MPEFLPALRILSAPENRSLLTRITRGIEKESLRVTAAGQLAQSRHPQALGSALTHPSITTDYSEALLEMITAPSQSIDDTLASLEHLHRFIYRQIDDELLWINSMPCSVGRDEDVPVALYGTSNVATMKTVYRLGLGHRYGRVMQTIAGIHYNWSVPDECLSLLQIACKADMPFQAYKTQRYFDLIRNFRRHSWLLLYLFGAAPAVCRSYVKGREHRLEPVGQDAHSLHTPYATSLRMGDLGYQSDAQASLTPSYNDLDNYVETLLRGLTESYPPYEQIGLKGGDGQYQQLTTNLLQIENEFYSTIRPKRTTRSGETPIRALRERGVEYIEVRCLDLNPFAALGIDREQILFLDIFLLHALLSDSPEACGQQCRENNDNQRDVVYEGRDPQLKLRYRGEMRSLREWSHSLFREMTPVATMLDEACGGDEYSRALAAMARRIDDPGLTPSARVISTLQDEELTFFQFALRQARANRDHFMVEPLAVDVEQHYRQLALKSLQDQRDIEASDSISFEDYLARYYRQYQR